MSSQNKYIAADDDSDDDIDESALPSYAPEDVFVPTPTSGKGKGRPQPDVLASPSGQQPLSGNIGSSGAGAGPAGGGSGGPRGPTRQKIGGIQVETRYSGVDTLDEPVLTTIGRDLTSIYTKLIQVLYPARSGANREVLRDWDLWGPLILCLALGIMLSLSAPPDQSLGVFTGVVVIVSVGSLVVTLNAKLLGGRVSFFQSLCVLGYCIFPLVVAALISTFFHKLFIRGPVTVAAWAWSVWAAMNFFDGTNIEQQRVLLAVYPLFLFYFILAWMILIQ
ncbi:hypothetical protein FRC04_011756 [Tulasnella sp. 424]|nr:hypothetical protein FRC04_011756 [Tulasnella sp. 424]KAG8978100.1 hypothetical protein FRC05_011216 [Tulasnella sp. 425]